MKKGFSIIEALIAVAVVVCLALVVGAAFSGFRDKQILNSAVEQLSSFISEARFKTLASEKSLQYGVHFEETRSVFFEGNTFIEPSANNKEFSFGGLVEISSIALNGGAADMVFKKLTGETDQYGSITVNLKKDISVRRIINVYKSGVIDVDF